LQKSDPSPAATQHVGFRQFQQALLYYPCQEPSTPTIFGPYELDVCVDGPIAPGRFPLVLISHGSGGSPLLYRSVSLHLAGSGCIVAALKHAGNSLGDDALADSAENFRNRPRQLIELLEALLSDHTLGPAISAGPVTAIGHSLGGYTALCVAGAQPWSRVGALIPVVHDPRVGALVLLAPACGPFLAPEALAKVAAPILALTAEHDALTPDVEIRTALAGVPDQDRVTIKTVPNAGHFSFLTPFPQQMHRPGFAPAADPSGFDRERFHQWLPQLILEWMRERGGLRGVLDSL
jgi:predicted dienelactone hydrolase